MGELIEFDYTKKGKQDTKMCREQIKLIVNRHTVQAGGKKEYFVADAIQIADEILSVYTNKPFGATPIFQVIKDFDFEAYNSDLDDFDEGRISGIIKVNGDTKELYNTDKIIITNVNDPFSHQRFVAAHELGHYIMDCLGDSKYLDSNILFEETYKYNSHQDKKEKCADQFAAELLMPTKKFVYRYNLASKAYFGNKKKIVEYLADYFQVKPQSIEKRVKEILLQEYTE